MRILLPINFIMQENVKYFTEEERFYILVDYPYEGASISTVNSVQDYINVDLDEKTGALYLIEIYKVSDILEASFSHEKIKYNEDEDCLSVSLSPNDDPNGPCDLVFRTEGELLISLNRSEAGNLTGFEIVGFQFAINHDDFVV